MLKKTAILLAATLGLSAQAHVTLEQAEAVAGSAYKAVLRVGHGCEGSPTTRITVTLPAGFRGAKPMPKAGWALELKREKLSKPYDSHGRQIVEDVVEVSWTAKSEDAYLQDAWYDEFVLRGSLPEATGPIWFKLRQSCVKGEWNWAELPAEGESTKGLKAPAVRLMLSKPAAEAGTHQH
ncbi:YcnI family copper-binding membrane protein [Roseateles oligotrophus]|uniref:YcnI family protein n=1 Tax=Roseateles oligotrophus TaxID=1769250 RepID=A0ABT2YKR3_9BURK|nr:YcnI family protein [Roseateles oligotrophus]MCV2370525.1 YcnI family protein [Roseateles oligotrophus]